MKRAVSFLVFAGALAACNGEANDEGGTPPRVTPTPTSTSVAMAPPAPESPATQEPEVEPPEPESTPPGPRSVEEETDDYLFEYSYPAAVGRIAPLASLLDRQIERRRTELARDSAAARRQARADGFPYNKHSYAAEWKVVSELPDWLSLAADIGTYTGGAHGNSRVDSLVWDKQRGRSMEAIELFTAPAALEEALGDRFCDALDRERARRRGEPVPEDSEDSFDQCPDIDELEVVVGSSNRRTFNRLTLYAAPYVAGPYAEGAYSVDLPVTRAIRDAVKPQYRASFTARN
jgi:hypothetical protein